MKNRNHHVVIGIVAILGFAAAFTACTFGPLSTGEPPHTHQWGEWTQTTLPTCTTAGIKTRACTLDPSHIDTETEAGDPALDHDWVQLYGIAATCTEPGSGTRECSRCDETETGVLHALGHNYSDWEVTTPASCTEEGEGTRACAHDAEHTETQVIPVDPDAHQWKQLAGTAPTCTTTGSGTRECELCVKTETLVIIPALGHNYSNWTVTTAAACTTAGVITGTCTHDSSHTTGSPIAALGHAYSTWTLTSPITSLTAVNETGTCSHDAEHTETRTGSFADYLSGLPANTADSPYIIALNINNLGGMYNDAGSLGNALYTNTTKYLSLDLSGSTFTSIGMNAFYNCSSLTGIIIPARVTIIGNSAFYGCSFTDITIPKSVSSIGNGAFRDCTRLTSVTFQGTILFTSFDSLAFLSLGDLRSKFYAAPNTATGTPGTYTRVSGGNTWKRQP